MAKIFFIIGALCAATAVAAGAFGAHALKTRLSPELLNVFETGVRYQMYHAFALLGTGLALNKWPGPLVQNAGWLFLLGILLFSGSLYSICLSEIKTLGIITPIGGLAFIGGWLCLALGVLRA